MATFTSNTTSKALSLWTGSGNNPAPANWEQPAFDDSAWPHAVQTAPWYGTNIWSRIVLGDRDNEHVLFRQWVTLPNLPVASALLVFSTDDGCEGVWINGTFIPGSIAPPTSPHLYSVTLVIPPTLLIPNAPNLVAAHAYNVYFYYAGWTFTFTVLGPPHARAWSYIAQ